VYEVAAVEVQDGEIRELMSKKSCRRNGYAFPFIPAMPLRPLSSCPSYPCWEAWVAVAPASAS
jgi:hypothetical protein